MKYIILILLIAIVFTLVSFTCYYINYLFSTDIYAETHPYPGENTFVQNILDFLSGKPIDIKPQQEKGI